MISPRTQATLAEITVADWFVSCGQPWSDSVVVLSSWRDAVESCQSEYWLWLTEEAANRLSRSVFQASRERFRSWNAIVEEVKSTTIPLVKTKTADLMSSFDLPQAFEDCVQWDILHLALEAEYADIVKPVYVVAPCVSTTAHDARMLVVYLLPARLAARPGRGYSFRHMVVEPPVKRALAVFDGSAVFRSRYGLVTAGEGSHEDVLECCAVIIGEMAELLDDQARVERCDHWLDHRRIEQPGALLGACCA